MRDPRPHPEPDPPTRPSSRSGTLPIDLGGAHATYAPLLDELHTRLPRGLGEAFASLRERLRDADDTLHHPLLLRLPAAVDEAGARGRGAAFEGYQEAHRLGWLVGWRGGLEGHRDAALLRTHLHDRWCDALRAVAPSAAPVQDQVSQAVRWMRWGQRARDAALREGRWSLSGYYRSLRWEARTLGLASECHLQRTHPGRVAAFARTFDLTVLGLAQLHDARGEGPGSLPRLLGCPPRALVEAGMASLELAGIEAQALGWKRFAGYCRYAVRAEHRPMRKEEREG